MLRAPISEPAEPMLGETARRKQARGALSARLGETEQCQRPIDISYGGERIGGSGEHGRMKPMEEAKRLNG